MKLGYEPRNTPKILQICLKNKNKIRTIWGWKCQKIRTAEPQQKFTGSYKKKSVIFEGKLNASQTCTFLHQWL